MILVSHFKVFVKKKFFKLLISIHLLKEKAENILTEK